MSIREFPGRITDIEWNQLCRYGLQKAVDRIILKSGSEYQVIDGNYGNIMYSGSNYDTVRNSMTGSLTGLVADRVGMAIEGYENGTIRNSVCLTGSLIYSTLITTVALIAPYVTGSIIVSGSNVYGENAKFTNITGSQISISGNAYVDGTISGSLVSDDVTAESVTAKYITGSTLVSGSIIAGQTGNIVNVNSTSVIATTVTGSTLVSGSTVSGRNGNFTNINATNITGSVLSGSNIYSPSAKITNVNATNITGSFISGSDIRSPTATITNLNSTNITGSVISGSNIYGPNAKITNVNATNITGSILSGSNIYGPNATITTVNSTNINGTNITGSIVSGSNIYGPQAKITNINAVNVTGSTSVSGSNIYGNYAKITNIVATNITGSLISGSTFVGSRGLTKNSQYVVYSGSGMYWAENGRTGNVEYSGSDAYSLINNVLLATRAGSRITLLGGIYSGSAPIEIVKDGVELYGEGTGGDLYFTNDVTEHGYSTKMPVCLIGDGFDVIEIGKDGLIFGTTIKNILITGIYTEAALSSSDDDVYSSGSGIRIYRGDTLTFENIQVQRKQYGFHFEPTGSFSTYNVIDKVEMKNIMLCFNYQGIYQSSWCANVRMKNIWGYINQYNLLNVNPSYDWTIEDVFSNADGWKGTARAHAPIYIGTASDVQLIRPKVFGSYGTARCPMSLIFCAMTKRLEGGTGSEWYSPHITIDCPELMETDTDAIYVDGTGGVLDIRNPHIGLISPDASQGWLGGTGSVLGSCINNTGDVSVKVYGGYANCAQSIKPNTWFIGCYKVVDVNNFNPIGVIAHAWNETSDWVGLEGEGATFTASTDYTIHGCDVFITASGGTGTSISIKDPSDNVILSGLSSLSMCYVPVGYKINFGGFSSLPTVIVCGV